MQIEERQASEMSELDEYKKQQQEMIEARRLKQELADGVLPEPQHAEHLPPKTFREKWQNYWYHYKWLTFGVIFFGGLGIWLLMSLLFPQRYDSSFSIMTEWSMSAYQEQITAPVQNLLQDYDGNGKVELEVQVYQAPSVDSEESTTDPQLVIANATRLMGNLSVGTYFIYLVDDVGYEYLKQNELQFLDLSEYVSEDRLEGGDRYQLIESELGSQMGLNPQFGNFTLCFLDPDSLGGRAETDEEIREAYERQWELFQALLAVG